MTSIDRNIFSLIFRFSTIHQRWICKRTSNAILWKWIWKSLRNIFKFLFLFKKRFIDLYACSQKSTFLSVFHTHSCSLSFSLVLLFSSSVWSFSFFSKLNRFLSIACCLLWTLCQIDLMVFYLGMGQIWDTSRLPSNILGEIIIHAYLFLSLSLSDSLFC